MTLIEAERSLALVWVFPANDEAYGEENYKASVARLLQDAVRQ